MIGFAYCRGPGCDVLVWVGTDGPYCPIHQPTEPEADAGPGRGPADQ